MAATATPDLADFHHPITDIFDRPESPAGWDRYRLTDEQVAFFHENGYLAEVPVLTEEQADSIVPEIEEAMNPSSPGIELFNEYYSNESQDPSRILFHALGGWRFRPGLHDLLWNPAFLVPALQLLGGPVRFWHDQLFCKPAHHGGVVAWHQDYSYWTRTQPMAHLTCWIGLDDSTVDNGCVHYVPGSHHWPLLPITGLAGNMDEIRTVLTPEQLAGFQPVAVELKRGQASFHHPLTVHGSYENRTERPRRAAVLNVFRDGVCSAADDEPLPGVPPIRAGAKMEGKFFPLLIDLVHS